MGLAFFFDNDIAPFFGKIMALAVYCCRCWEKAAFEELNWIRVAYCTSIFCYSRQVVLPTNRVFSVWVSRKSVENLSYLVMNVKRVIISGSSKTLTWNSRILRYPKCRQNKQGSKYCWWNGYDQYLEFFAILLLEEDLSGCYWCQRNFSKALLELDRSDLKARLAITCIVSIRVSFDWCICGEGFASASTVLRVQRTIE